MRIRLLGHYFHSSIIALATVEAVLFTVSVYAAALLRTGAHLHDLEQLHGSLLPRALLFGVVAFISLLAVGLYTTRQRAGAVGLAVRVAAALVAAVGVVAVVFYLLPSLAMGRGVLALAAVLSLAGSLVVRYVFSHAVDSQAFKRQVLVYGYGNRVKAFAKLRRRSDRRGYNVVGFVCPPGESLDVPSEELLFASEGLKALCQQLQVEEVVVALEDWRRNLPVRELLQCRLAGINVIDLVSFMERETGRIYLDALNPSWMIFGHGFSRSGLRLLYLPRPGLLASLALLVLTLPIMLLTALAIWIEDGRKGGDILYRQLRVGLDGEPFTLLKFRSMRADAEAGGKAAVGAGERPACTRRSARSSARYASTSCRSCSTCCAAT